MPNIPHHMKDHTIYHDEEARTLAGIEDQMLRDKTDGFCRQMASAESSDRLNEAYIEACTWLLSVQDTTDTRVLKQISMIIETVSVRAQVSFTIGNSEIVAA